MKFVSYIDLTLFVPLQLLWERWKSECAKGGSLKLALKLSPLLQPQFRTGFQMGWKPSWG